MIEKLRKRPVEVETILWDGSVYRANGIKAWVGRTPTSDEPAFLTAAEVFGAADHAMLYVAHNNSWSPLPVGYRVARELDGSGFYPLSPEGAAAGYETPSESHGMPAHVFPAGSQVDALLPEGVHRYWSTHCRHGNHADCKGSCKICASACVCAGCTHQPGREPAQQASAAVLGPVVGGIATGSPAAAGRKPTSSEIPSDCVYDVWGADFGAQAGAQCLNSDPAHQDVHHAPLPADEPVSVPPPVGALLERDDDLTGGSARTMDELAELIDDWDQSREGWRAIHSKACDLWASGVEEGRRQARAAALREAYWKLREHASGLRSSFVYTNAEARAKEAVEAAREGIAMGSDGRWKEKAHGLRSHARGVEAGARTIAEMLDVEEHEIERPAVDGG